MDYGFARAGLQKALKFLRWVRDWPAYRSPPLVVFSGTLAARTVRLISNNARPFNSGFAK